MSQASTSVADRQFMDEMASSLSPWGWSRHVARIFAYLLMREEPATLDDIAAHCDIAKSLASVAARQLHQQGTARRECQPGTKRLLYSVPETRCGPFAHQAAMIGNIAALLERQQPESARVANRLAHFSAFLSATAGAIEEVCRRPEFRD